MCASSRTRGDVSGRLDADRNDLRDDLLLGSVKPNLTNTSRIIRRRIRRYPVAVRTPEHPVVVSSGDSRSSRLFTTTTTTHDDDIDDDDDDDDDFSRRRRRRLFTTTGVRDARSFVDIGDDIHGDALVWKGAHGDARRRPRRRRVFFVVSRVRYAEM